VHACRHCSREVEDRFRYCPWCAAPQRTKLVEWFAPHPEVADDAAKGLRVSRYLAGGARPRQVRVSIWEGERAAAAISLTEQDAAELGAFVSWSSETPVEPRR
jgi:hypothetical protein